MNGVPARLLTVALAAVLAVGGLGGAVASGKKKPGAARDPAQSLMFDYDGTPIIMQGLQRPKKAAPEKSKPNGRVERPRKVPRGSSTYIPPPQPSPSATAPPPLTKPPEVYRPPQIKSFGDRVIECIHSYPLNAGIGNNPNDRQMYIRQCAN